jgi:hypothetical protein
MRAVTYTLRFQMKRPEIADLHAVLTFLRLTTADEEKVNQRFGASTRAAVPRFQLDHKLPRRAKSTRRPLRRSTKSWPTAVCSIEPSPGGESSGPESAYQLQTAALVLYPQHGDPAQSLSCVANAAGRRSRLPDPRYADQGRDLYDLSKGQRRSRSRNGACRQTAPARFLNERRVLGTATLRPASMESTRREMRELPCQTPNNGRNGGYDDGKL